MRVLPVLLLCSCNSYRTMSIESNVRAEISNGNLECKETPCVMRVSRETCWLFDSSSGYIFLTARSGGMAMRSMAIKTCDITDKTRIRFVFPWAGGIGDCTVIYFEGKREIYRTRCAESLIVK